MKKIIVVLFLVLSGLGVRADYILIPMDYTQSQHLKAYGIAYWVLEHGIEVEWLLNYRGGSFMYIWSPAFEEELTVRGVKYERISNGKSTEILAFVTSKERNMDAVKLEKPPKVAVYSPKNKQPLG